MIPSKTHDIVGPGQVQRAYNEFRDTTDEYFAIRGGKLVELRVLATRFNHTMTGDELRDWQNLLNGLIDECKRTPL